MDLPYDPRGTADQYTAAPKSVRGVAAADGTCTLTVGPVPTGYRWLISYVTVTTTGGGGTPALSLYIDEATPPNLLDGTTDAISAVAPYNPQRVLDQGQKLIAVWSGAAVGASCSLRVEYDVTAAS